MKLVRRASNSGFTSVQLWSSSSFQLLWCTTNCIFFHFLEWHPCSPTIELFWPNILNSGKERLLQLNSPTGNCPEMVQENHMMSTKFSNLKLNQASQGWSHSTRILLTRHITIRNTSELGGYTWLTGHFMAYAIIMYCVRSDNLCSVHDMHKNPSSQPFSRHQLAPHLLCSKLFSCALQISSISPNHNSGT